MIDTTLAVLKTQCFVKWYIYSYSVGKSRRTPGNDFQSSLEGVWTAVRLLMDCKSRSESTIFHAQLSIYLNILRT